MQNSDLNLILPTDSTDGDSHRYTSVSDFNIEGLVNLLTREQRIEMFFQLFDDIDGFRLRELMKMIFHKIGQENSEHAMYRAITEWILFSQQYRDYTLEQAIEAFKETCTFDRLREANEGFMEVPDRD